MNRATYTLGFWAALLAFAATLTYVVVQVLQVVGALPYPWDEIWIYGSSLCIVLPFLLAMLVLHYHTPDTKKLWSHGALLFTVIYAVFVTANYVVQLATVIPTRLQGGDVEGIRVLEQTPHSLFWNYDAIGYIFMGLATLLALPAFNRQGFERWVRLSFLIHALTTPLITVVYFYPTYSETLLLLGFPWGVTAPTFMLMLALLFYKKKRNSTVSSTERVDRDVQRFNSYPPGRMTETRRWNSEKDG